MSKKLEYMEKAVLYANQKPIDLAKVIAGLVTDVATTLTLEGSKTLTGGSDTVKQTYTALVLSQYGDVMSTPKVVYSLESPVSGVTIDTNTGEVSVTSAVADKTTFTVKAVAGSFNKTLKVTVVKPKE